MNETKPKKKENENSNEVDVNDVNKHQELHPRFMHIAHCT